MKKLSRLTAAALVCLALTACSDSNPASAAPSPASAAPAPKVDYAALQKGAKGFNVGSAVSARTVYVFFDAQCPHCGHLWEAAKPLQSSAKFVWIPVAVLNRASYTQGATLLASSDPVRDMNEHESLLAARKGGITALQTIPDDVKAAMEGNTKLLNSFNVDSIPFIVSENPQTHQLVAQAGAMGTQQLAALLGLPAPASAAAAPASASAR